MWSVSGRTCWGALTVSVREAETQPLPAWGLSLGRSLGLRLAGSALRWAIFSRLSWMSEISQVMLEKVPLN